MAANTITRSRLRQLAQISPARGRVLSVFMNLDPSELPTPAARSSAITSVMTDAAHRVEQANDLAHDEREALKADVQRVREVLGGSDVGANGTRAVAVYACQEEDLLEVVSLRHPLGSRVVLDRTPYVEPLVREGGAERWCVLLANRRVARLFTGDGEELEETDRIEDDVHSQHDQGGWSQSRYQRGVEKEKDDHLHHTADIAFELYRRRGFDRMLIGAPEELVNELEAKLHSYLQKLVVGRVQCDVENSSVEEVRACAAERILEVVRNCEREALDRLVQGVGSGGRGAGGLRDVLGALAHGKVEILLIARGFTAPGFCDAVTGVLYADEADAPPGTALEPVEDVAEKAIERALEQSAEVIGVRHHDDLGPLGGIGAVLRY
jgi:peptide chain release factor subunit 1